MNFVGLKNVRLPIYKNINFKHVTPIYKNKTPWYTTNLYKFIKLAVTEAFPMTSKKIWTPIFPQYDYVITPKTSCNQVTGQFAGRQLSSTYHQ